MNTNLNNQTNEKKVDYRKCFANHEKYPHEKYPVEMIKDCSALIEPLCRTQGYCPFFKTKDEVEFERMRSKIRLVKMGLDDIYNSQYKLA